MENASLVLIKWGGTFDSNRVTPMFGLLKKVAVVWEMELAVVAAATRGRRETIGWIRAFYVCCVLGCFIQRVKSGMVGLLNSVHTCAQ